MLTLTRLPLALAVLPLLAPNLAEVSIESRTGLSYEMSSERTMSLRLGEASMTVAGEEFPADMLAASVPDRDDAVTIVLRDVVVQAEEGRPVEVLREFVELTKKKTEAEEVSEESGALEGLKLVLELDGDEVEASFEDDAKATVDDEFLEDHLMEHLAYLIMPDDAVEPGDSWTPDDDALRAFLLPSGPHYFEPEEQESLSDLLEDLAEFSAEFTFRKLEELDGVECYVIEFQAELEATIDDLPEALTGDSQTKEGSIQVEGEFTGVLWISVEAHFPVKLEVENELIFDVEMHMDHDGMPIEMNMELLVKNENETVWEILE